MKIIHMLGSAAAILAVAVPMNAWAQQVGTYNGTTADGNSVSFTVGVDPSNGDFEITGATIFFTATCQVTGDMVNTGWGFGMGQDIVGGTAPFQSGDEYFDIYSPANIVFHGTQTVTGHLVSRTAVFRSGTPPTQAEFCISPSQAFTATFSTTDRASPLPVGSTAVYHGRTNGTDTRDVVPANR